MSADEKKEVSTGAAVGIGFLCWFFTSAICMTLTWIVSSTMFHSPQVSTGNLLGMIFGAIGGVRYKETGSVGKALWIAFILGVVLSILVIALSYLLTVKGIYR